MRQNRMKAINETLEFVRNALADLRPQAVQPSEPTVVAAEEDPEAQPTGIQPVVTPCGRLLPGSEPMAPEMPSVADVIIGKMQKSLSSVVGDLVAGGFVGSDQERQDLNDCVSDLVNAATTWVVDMCPWTAQREVCRKFAAKMEQKSDRI